MRLLIVNPNATASMTATIERSARAVASPGTEIVAVTSASGPPAIESHTDEALAVPGLLAAIREHADADAVVVACFGDPGLDAAREVALGPVVGIAEAGMRTAGYLARGFSVVTTLGRTTGRARELAERYGVRSACRRVRACEIPVLGLEEPEARHRVTEECRRAVTEDDADAVVLGCAGMAELCAAISADIGAPVIDGVAAATRAAESLVALGLSTSRRGEYAAPPVRPADRDRRPNSWSGPFTDR